MNIQDFAALLKTLLQNEKILNVTLNGYTLVVTFQDGTQRTVIVF